MWGVKWDEERLVDVNVWSRRKIIEERLRGITKAAKSIRSLSFFFFFKFLNQITLFSLSCAARETSLFLTIAFSYLFKLVIQKSFSTHDVPPPFTNILLECIPPHTRPFGFHTRCIYYACTLCLYILSLT